MAEFSFEILSSRITNILLKKSNIASLTSCMLRVSSRTERIAVVAMLFLLLIPCFKQAGEPTPPLKESPTVSTPRCSFDVSIFLKDNEEKENEEFFFLSGAVPLLDLSNHILKLQATHQSEYSILSHDLRTTILQPLVLICTLLI
mgnify:CR=1 FL=1